MPKPKRQSSGNESDSDDGGFLTRFHHLPTVNAPAEPVRIINIRENTLTSSYVLTSSRTVITVSMIFALLESLLCGLGTISVYEMEMFGDWNGNIKIIAVAVFIFFITGEGFRIYLVSRWWGISPRSDIEPNRAYEETIKCFKNSSLLILFVICPVCLIVISAVYVLSGGLNSNNEVPNALIIFLLVAGFDLILFVPCFACPTAICAACFWKRFLRRHERGMEYLRQSES